MKHSRLTSLPVIDLASGRGVPALRACARVPYFHVASQTTARRRGNCGGRGARGPPLGGDDDLAASGDSQARRTPGYGPGLQYSPSTEQESYETEEGVTPRANART